MSLQRRLALLDWARESGAFIFEDDYDSQLRFTGRPLAALKSLDAGDSVIYSNSFNKMLFSSLRLAFVVVPPLLVDAVTATRSVIERFPQGREQATLCDFIAEGHMEHHMRRMREVYETRFEALLSSSRRHLTGLMEFASSGVGLQAVGWLGRDIDEEEASEAAARQGINTVPLSWLMIERHLPPALVLGIGSADVPSTHREVVRLGEVLRQVRSRRVRLRRAAGG
jgi:GntR family transcriptional regulator/MocR family aminotransferase